MDMGLQECSKKQKQEKKEQQYLDIMYKILEILE